MCVALCWCPARLTLLFFLFATQCKFPFFPSLWGQTHILVGLHCSEYQARTQCNRIQVELKMAVDSQTNTFPLASGGSIFFSHFLLCSRCRCRNLSATYASEAVVRLSCLSATLANDVLNRKLSSISLGFSAICARNSDSVATPERLATVAFHSQYHRSISVRISHVAEEKG